MSGEGSGTARRDLDVLEERFAAWLGARRPDLAEATIESLRRPTSGLANETLIVTLTPRPGEPSGRRLVLRLPPEVASFPDTDFTVQAAVQQVVADAGVPTAVPATVELDESWLGVPFIVLPFIEGNIPGAAAALDPWIMESSEAEQQQVQDQMIGVLTAVSSLDATSMGATGLRGGSGSLADEAAWWWDYLEWAAEGDVPPRLGELVRWCVRTCPTTSPPPSLLWGDPRLENLILSDEREVVCVLDWEMASIGPAEMDLAWYLGLEKAIASLMGGQRVPGFHSDDEVIALYEAGIGRPVQDFAWHEVFAVARSICVSFRLALLAKKAGEKYFMPGGDKNPLLPLAEGWIADLEG